MLDRRSWDGSSEDDSSVYEDELSEGVEGSIALENQSNSGHHPHQGRNLDSGDYGSSSCGLDDLEEAKQRRRTALMGIVDGLKLGLKPAQQGAFRDDQSESERK